MTLNKITLSSPQKKDILRTSIIPSTAYSSPSNPTINTSKSNIISDQPSNILPNEILIYKTYILNAKKKLGSGAFGEIYYGKNLNDPEKEYAIKLESTNSHFQQLFYESKVYISLVGGIGIPNLYWSGSQGNFNIMIIDLLGKSLEDCFNYCSRNFSLKTVILIIQQMINRVEFIHSRFYIHRDIKPSNFLIGKKEKKNIIYIIDFGLAKRYRDPKTHMHIKFRDGKSLTGTARFASIYTHLGFEQSRRDDLESILYVLVYFLKGSLPWQGLKAKTIKEKYNKIMDTKINTSINKLCEGLPKKIKKLFYYTKDLLFDENPDYNYYLKVLNEIAIENSIKLDDIFDWTIKEEQEEKKKKG